MFEMIGAVRRDGRAVCKACGCPFPENPFPNYSWSNGSSCYEEYRCPKCGQKIVVAGKEERRRA